MLDMIKKLLGADNANESADINDQSNLQVATCALFVEMALIDGEFTDDERNSIIDIMGETFSLSSDQTTEIIKAAVTKVEQSVDSWQITKYLNENLSKANRVIIVENLWRLVLADGHMDKHETYLTNKVSGLLKLSHEEYIAAKQKALQKN
jgi:uncharacterized tellurite resistance protein B-like protein